MYIALVLTQTLILPVASAIVELVAIGGDSIGVFGRWFLFWGVGTRLFVAGLSQIARPGFTTGAILGHEDEGAAQVVQELGFTNASVGLVAMIAATFAPEWTVPTAIIGGAFLGLAGLRHVTKRGLSRAELVATWTDLIVGAVMAIYVIWLLTTPQA